MKGVIYTLEAVIGTIILVAGITAVLQNPQEQPGFSSTGYMCLESLDKTGQLALFAVSDMDDELAASLRGCLPATLDFAVKVCPSADCSESLPSGRSVYASSYIIAGHDSYDRKLVNLWVWMR
jgi:hypothetical protein